MRTVDGLQLKAVGRISFAVDRRPIGLTVDKEYSIQPDQLPRRAGQPRVGKASTSAIQPPPISITFPPSS